MPETIRRIRTTDPGVADTLIIREWLVANGLGGYASGTVSGFITRRYHGLLIAAMPAPLGRVIMLNYLSELFTLPDGRNIVLGDEKLDRGLFIDGTGHLREFRLEDGMPVWEYDFGGSIIEKRIIMPHLQNTTLIRYTCLSGKEKLKVQLRPALHIRPHNLPLNEPFTGDYSLRVSGQGYEIFSDSNFPMLRLSFGDQGTFTIQSDMIRDIYCRVEAERGYYCHAAFWCPGFFSSDMEEHQSRTFTVSTESWAIIQAMTPDEAFRAEEFRRSRLVNRARRNVEGKIAEELVFAADQFIITPTGRIEDATRANARGDQIRTVIAGYHWFTDWGRDTMISLEGLTLTTGRFNEAGWILRTFSQYIKEGLIPNLFPEGESEGRYHTADATLWFFHALDRYLEVTGNRYMLPLLYPRLEEIIDHHLRGTRFGIGIDPEDGLLRQGEERYQLTWMDAKVGDWVVTPRRGKAVEINALWYNALCLMETWARQERGAGESSRYAELAGRARISFNRRFWYAKGKYLYDVVDTEHGKDDASLRPNQVLAISLRHPVLDQDKWESVLAVVERELLTPVGLRSLAKSHPDYKKQYFGDIHARDAAYHQGTVWAWLIGPFIDAWLKLHPGDYPGARKFLEGFDNELSEACIGSIGEIFDAESPFTPRGCVAQAWSVAEVLRCLSNTRTR